MACQDGEFRRAMRLLASGVTVIATAHDRRRSGLTATAVCSLAMSPARILACINLRGYTYELLSRSRCASINILAEDHQRLADRFAGRAGEDDGQGRFADGDWVTSATGAPLLADALVALDCSIMQMSVLDTHAILLCQVEDAMFGRLRPPLVQFEAAYTTGLISIAAGRGAEHVQSG